MIGHAIVGFEASPALAGGTPVPFVRPKKRDWQIPSHVVGEARRAEGAARRICIIGMGNRFRSDDGAGIWVADRAAAAGWAGVTAVALHAREGTALLHAWEGAEVAYLVDAVSADLPPGTILRLDARHLTQVAGVSALSSHGLSLTEAVAMGRALGLLPRQLVVYGIVGNNFDHGTVLSPDVEGASARVFDRLRRAVVRLRAHHA